MFQRIGVVKMDYKRIVTVYRNESNGRRKIERIELDFSLQATSELFVRMRKEFQWRNLLRNGIQSTFNKL